MGVSYGILNCSSVTKLSEEKSMEALKTKMETLKNKINGDVEQVTNGDAKKEEVVEEETKAETEEEPTKETDETVEEATSEKKKTSTKDKIKKRLSIRSI